MPSRVILAEKGKSIRARARARYHPSNGKWYSNSRVVFHAGGFYSTRYYSATPPAATPPTPLPARLRPSSCPSHQQRTKSSPADLSRVWPPFRSFRSCALRVYLIVIACPSAVFNPLPLPAPGERRETGGIIIRRRRSDAHCVRSNTQYRAFVLRV